MAPLTQHVGGVWAFVAGQAATNMEACGGLPPLARASPTVAVYEVCVALYKPGRPRQARLQLSFWADKVLKSSLLAL